MDGIIQQGKTVRDAIERGLATLGIPEEDVEVIVLDEGAKGLFGVLGKRGARVRLVPALSEERVRRLVEKLLGLMGFGGQVEVTASQNRIVVSIETAGMDGLLIGRHGQTLDAIQHVVDRMVNRGRKDRCKVSVDIAGYKKRRRASVQSRAPISQTSFGEQDEVLGAGGNDGPGAEEEGLVHSVPESSPGPDTEPGRS